MTVRKLERRDHYAADYSLVLRQTNDDQETTLQTRRVIHMNGREELQIEITITKLGMKRNQSMHSSFCMDAAHADMLAEACKVVVADRRMLVTGVYVARHERAEAIDAYGYLLTDKQKEAIDDTDNDLWLELDYTNKTAIVRFIEDEG